MWSPPWWSLLLPANSSLSFSSDETASDDDGDGDGGDEEELWIMVEVLFWKVGVTAGEEKTLRKLFFNSDPTAIDLGLDCPVRQTRLRKAFDKFVFRRELASFTPQGVLSAFPPGNSLTRQLRTSWWREHSLRWVVTPPPCLWLSWCHPPLSLSLPLFSDYPPCLTESPPSPSPTCFAHFTFQ